MMPNDFEEIAIKSHTPLTASEAQEVARIEKDYIICSGGRALSGGLGFVSKTAMMVAAMQDRIKAGERVLIVCGGPAQVEFWRKMLGESELLKICDNSEQTTLVSNVVRSFDEMKEPEPPKISEYDKEEDRGCKRHPYQYEKPCSFCEDEREVRQQKERKQRNRANDVQKHPRLVRRMPHQNGSR